MTTTTESANAQTLATDALFCSKLPTGSYPTGAQLTKVLRHAHRATLVYRVAQAFTQDPAAAAAREQWCRRTMAAAWDGLTTR